MKDRRCGVQEASGFSPRRFTLRFVVVLTAGLLCVAAGTGVGQEKAEQRPKSDEILTTQQAQIKKSYEQMLSGVKRRMAELQTKLAQYRQGNRDDRDGYVILSQLRDCYAALRLRETPEAEAVGRELIALKKKHPNFEMLTDFTLSEEIGRKKQLQESTKRIQEKAKNWRPEDKSILRVYAKDRKLAIKYQYRMEFYDVPADVQYTLGGSSIKLHKKLLNGELREIGLGDLPRTEQLTFRYPIAIRPKRWSLAPDAPLLVCTDLLGQYSDITEEEHEIARAAPTVLAWENAHAQYDDFCGIISHSGKIIYRFNFKQRKPDRLLEPLGIANDGKYAAVVVKDIKQAAREVLIWEYPQTVRRVKAAGDGIDALWDRFSKRDL